MVAQCIRDNFITIKRCGASPCKNASFMIFFWCNFAAYNESGWVPDFEENAYLLKVGGTLSNFLKNAYICLIFGGEVPMGEKICAYIILLQLQKQSTDVKHIKSKSFLWAFDTLKTKTLVNKTPSFKTEREVWRKCVHKAKSDYSERSKKCTIQGKLSSWYKFERPGLQRMSKVCFFLYYKRNQTLL